MFCVWVLEKFIQDLFLLFILSDSSCIYLMLNLKCEYSKKLQSSDKRRRVNSNISTWNVAEENEKVANLWIK